jgi:hypothetical protein
MEGRKIVIGAWINLSPVRFRFLDVRPWGRLDLISIQHDALACYILDTYPETTRFFMMAKR